MVSIIVPTISIMLIIRLVGSFDILPMDVTLNLKRKVIFVSNIKLPIVFVVDNSLHLIPLMKS